MTTASKNTLVLVTGASGFIAGHCVRELLEHGYAVRGTVRSLQAREKYAHLQAFADRTGGTLELVEADLGSDRGWKGAVAACTYVWHVGLRPLHRRAVGASPRALSTISTREPRSAPIVLPPRSCRAPDPPAPVASGRKRCASSRRFRGEAAWRR